MSILVRRLLVLAVLGFWLGGFAFYTAVVVPMGRRVLGSHQDQGFITQRVTNYLNLAGGIALASLAWDAAVSGDCSRRRKRARWAAWLGMAITLAALAWLHLQMDDLLDSDAGRILDRPAFRWDHHIYLNTSAFQWACGLVYTVLALLAWREEDRQATPHLPADPGTA